MFDVLVFACKVVVCVGEDTVLRKRGSRISKDSKGEESRFHACSRKSSFGESDAARARLYRVTSSHDDDVSSPISGDRRRRERCEIIPRYYIRHALNATSWRSTSIFDFEFEMSKFVARTKLVYTKRQKHNVRRVCFSYYFRAEFNFLNVRVHRPRARARWYF